MIESRKQGGNLDFTANGDYVWAPTWRATLKIMSAAKLTSFFLGVD